MVSCRSCRSRRCRAQRIPRRHAGRPARFAVGRALKRRARLGGRPRAGPRAIARPGRRAREAGAALGRAHDAGGAAEAFAGAGAVADARGPAAGRGLRRAAIPGVGTRNAGRQVPSVPRVLAGEAGLGAPFVTADPLHALPGPAAGGVVQGSPSGFEGLSEGRPTATDPLAGPSFPPRPTSVGLVRLAPPPAGPPHRASIATPARKRTRGSGERKLRP